MPVRSPASAATKSAKEVNESTLWLPPGATCAIAKVIGPVVLGTKLSPVDTAAGSSCSGPIRITCTCALWSVDCVMRTWVALNGASNGAVTPGDAHASRAKALGGKSSAGLRALKSGGAEPSTARARIERAVAARVGAEGPEELQTLADRDVLGTEAAALAILRDGRGAGHRDRVRPAELLIVAVARVGPCMADGEHVAAA